MSTDFIFIFFGTRIGGTTALLALNGLFTLITKHNLEYPDFFTKVYALLDRMVLHSRYRARFFRMLGVFMGSTFVLPFSSVFLSH